MGDPTTGKSFVRVGDYQILRDISHSKRYKTLKAKNHKDEFFVLVTVDRENALLHYKKRLHEQDPQMDEEEVDKLAQEKVSGDMKELHHIYNTAKDFSHPNLPAVYDWISDAQSKQEFLVMEYTLPVESNIFQATEGLLPRQMISLFIPPCEAVCYINRQGYLHGNLKPSIIRVNMETPPVIKLATFGHLTSLNGDKQGLKGTGFYVAPEVALQKWDQVGPWSDVYPLGVSMYYCMTRKLPFAARQMFTNDAEKLARHIEKHETPPPPMRNCVSNPDLIPKDLDDLVSKMMEPDPEKRIQNFQAAINFCFEHWPEESKAMPIVGTITTR